METKFMAEGTLTIEILNNQPIELIDFTESFYAFGQEYNKFLIDSGEKLSPQAKLFIKEIKTGSIIALLSDNTPLIIPFIENTSTIIAFAKFLKEGLSWLRGGDKPKKELDTIDMRNMSKIVNPVAKDSGSQLNINGNVNIESLTISLSSLEANAIQNNIRRIVESNKIPNTSTQEKVAFYWDTTKYDPRSTAVDKGFIDSIYPKPLKVVFDDEKLKEKMINTNDNFFHLVFIVDVELVNVNTQPWGYKILKLHESIPK